MTVWLFLKNLYCFRLLGVQWKATGIHQRKLGNYNFSVFTVKLNIFIYLHFWTFSWFQVYKDNKLGQFFIYLLLIRLVFKNIFFTRKLKTNKAITNLLIFLNIFFIFEIIIHYKKHLENLCTEFQTYLFSIHLISFNPYLMEVKFSCLNSAGRNARFKYYMRCWAEKWPNAQYVNIITNIIGNNVIVIFLFLIVEFFPLSFLANMKKCKKKPRIIKTKM